MTTETLARSPVIRLDPADNVVVAREDIAAGVSIPSEGVTTNHDVPVGHKLATRPIAKGDPVLKYNTTIGFAGEDIAPGDWLHAHNVLMDEVQKDYRHAQDYVAVELLPENERATFLGYPRADGRYGTRNMIGIFITVNCAATVARMISRYFDEERLADYPNVDGVVAFIHEQGCGMEQTGEPLDLLRRTLAGYIRHPNTAGALVCSLGCERNNLQRFMEAESLDTGKMLRTVTMQQIGGTKAAIEEGKAVIREMLEEANRIEREPASAEHITIGLQCGGSDGFSGLSANPALGKAVDILVRHGGTAILSETSELYGVEHTLTARAKSEEIGRKFIERIDWWLDYNAGRDTQINGRVSPGNQEGGLANVIEKSLGGAKKGGSTGINAVYEYAYPVTEKGLVLMDTPGFDPVSATGQIAGGANLICFTTGRGSCFGSYPAPTIKLASNTPMYTRMQGDMDLNCGQVIDGTKTLDEMGEEIFAKILATASGAPSKSELLGVGEEEFAPWQIGVLS
ncbi:altronate dehydratase family protein [Psychromarinibacter sp. C21-152]|uniref:Altronate dehydratase family protein n=1 Tax=Psychromarinibacter sediminicola TaxID=3033385 RepID=A0AAE3NT62_9RHOB|nr:altronate dehydratase family protein [Psychromarinibacter sediminicola]MDF0601971.1 altronate dehydratase family protein [Psychromarinibacter sediminicola]